MISNEDDTATCDNSTRNDTLISPFPYAILIPTTPFGESWSSLPSLFAITLLTISLFYLIRRFSWRNHPLYKSNIPVVPYILPWIGSGLSFKSNAVDFISRWSKRFDSPIFGAYIAGRPFLFLTDPTAAAFVISGRIPQFVWESKYLIHKNAMGESPEGAKIVFETKEGHGIVEKYLFGSTNLGETMMKYQDMLLGETIPSLLSSSSDDDGGCGGGWKQLQIMEFFGQALFRTTAKCIYGYTSLATREYFESTLRFIGIFPNFIITPKFTHKLRHPDEYEAREDLIAKVKEILSEGRRHRSGSSDNDDHNNPLSDLVRDMDELYKHKLSEDDLARYQYMLFLVSVINQMPTMFWTMYTLLAHREAYDAIHAEVSNISSTKTENEQRHFSLSQLEEMVLLDSHIRETMRLITSHKLLRTRATPDHDVDLNLPFSDGTIRRLNIRRGTVIASCPTLVHRDEEIFEDPHSFWFDRFAPRGGKPPVFRKNGMVIKKPVDMFGGGPHICAGRRFAMAGIKAVVANVLLEYELRFAEGVVPKKMPEMYDTKAPVTNGLPGSDVSFEIRKRVH